MKVSRLWIKSFMMLNNIALTTDLRKGSRSQLKQLRCLIELLEPHLSREQQRFINFHFGPTSDAVRGPWQRFTFWLTTTLKSAAPKLTELCLLENSQSRLSALYDVVYDAEMFQHLGITNEIIAEESSSPSLDTAAVIASGAEYLTGSDDAETMDRNSQVLSPKRRISPPIPSSSFTSPSSTSISNVIHTTANATTTTSNVMDSISTEPLTSESARDTLRNRSRHQDSSSHPEAHPILNAAASSSSSAHASISSGTLPHPADLRVYANRVFVVGTETEGVGAGSLFRDENLLATGIIGLVVLTISVLYAMQSSP